MKYRLEFDYNSGRLTDKQLSEAVRELNSRAVHYEKLRKYYEGNNTEITNTSRSISRNPVIVPYARKVVNTVTGYMFKPGAVGYSTENEALKDQVDKINYQNHETLVTSELGKICSIYGVAYEIHFVGEGTDGGMTPRFVPAEPIEVMVIYDYALGNDEPVCALRVYTIGDDRRVDAYYADAIEHFYQTKGGKINAVTIAAEEGLAQAVTQHDYGMVPVVEYVSNEEQKGDFECVLPLIDAYDILMSDSVTEIEKLAEAYLVLTNHRIGDEDAKSIKHKRIIELFEGGKAEFLVKNVSPELLRFMRDWIREEIHAQSQIPNMTDMQFAGNQSGVAIRYKLSDLENICATKEIFFTNGLYRRLELVDRQADDLWGDVGGVNEIDITFTRNIPMNYVEIAQIVQGLRGHVSLRTILERVVPFVENAQEEIKRLDDERQMVNFDDDDIEEEPVE